MVAVLEEMRARLAQYVSSCDVDTLHGADALALLKTATELESIAASLKLSLAHRVEQTNQHQSLGYRSASDLVASRTGMSGAGANSALATARRLQDLPETRLQFASGQLSASQVAEVARGAAIDPSAEKILLERASFDSNEALRRERARIETSKLPSLGERRRKRRFCYRPGEPGLTDFWGTLPNEDFAFLKSELDSKSRKFFVEARSANRHESQSAYLADALADLAKSGDKRVNINVVVEHEALVGQTGKCEIPGFGPISPEVAMQWADGCWLNVLLRKGKDITTIANERRYVPADVKRALDIRERVCSVRGCEQSVGLELDHLEELRNGGLTKACNLALLCRHHHKLKTHDGFELIGEPGDYTLVPPQSRLFPPGAA